jgi:hypothetical protein
MELRRIGIARRKLDAAQRKLRKETIRALRKHDGALSRTEAAELVGLSRSTTHGFYAPH